MHSTTVLVQYCMRTVLKTQEQIIFILELENWNLLMRNNTSKNMG